MLGTYRAVMPSPEPQFEASLQLNEYKAIYRAGMGEHILDYSVSADRVSLHSGEARIVFDIVSPDTLRSTLATNMSLNYVRVQ